MGWNLNWRFWQREMAVGAFRKAKGGEYQEPRTTRDWEALLIEGGVSSKSVSRIAAQLSPAYTELGRGSAAALLRGVTLAMRAQAGEKVGGERSLRDVREVERLLGAFSGELEKLDEVLEVLAAYAQRMRSRPGRSDGHTLH